MLFRTHISLGFLIALTIVKFFNSSNNILFIIVFLLFSLLPDLDNYSSKISKKLRPFSFIIQPLFGHRGIFHTVYFPVALSLFLVFIDQRLIALAVLLGYLSHLFLDALTVKGIRPFYPLTKKRIHGFIQVDSIFENLLFLIILVLIFHKVFF